MRLSTKGRYAVMALVDLGLHGKGKPVTLTDISLRQNISLSYLEQLFARLRRAGLVRSIRGPGGGYTLTHGAENTKVGDIVTAAEENLRVTRCKGAGSPKGCMLSGSRCITHDLWEELGNHIQHYLSTVTIADILHRNVHRDVSPAKKIVSFPMQEIA